MANKKPKKPKTQVAQQPKNNETQARRPAANPKPKTQATYQSKGKAVTNNDRPKATSKSMNGTALSNISSHGPATQNMSPIRRTLVATHGHQQQAPKSMHGTDFAKPATTISSSTPEFRHGDQMNRKPAASNHEQRAPEPLHGTEFIKPPATSPSQTHESKHGNQMNQKPLANNYKQQSPEARIAAPKIHAAKQTMSQEKVAAWASEFKKDSETRNKESGRMSNPREDLHALDIERKDIVMKAKLMKENERLEMGRQEMGNKTHSRMKIPRENFATHGPSLRPETRAPRIGNDCKKRTAGRRQPPRNAQRVQESRRVSIEFVPENLGESDERWESDDSGEQVLIPVLLPVASHSTIKVRGGRGRRKRAGGGEGCTIL